MDLYSTERWILDRHREMTAAAERHARLGAPRPAAAPLRLWAACRLRSLADRLDGSAAFSASEA